LQSNSIGRLTQSPPSRPNPDLLARTDTMTDIVLACCILHNFLRMVDNDDSFLEEIDRDSMQGDIDVSHSQNREDDYKLGS